jgi:hypothetical protein
MPDLHPRIAGALREPIAPIAPPATLEARVLSAVAGAAMEAAPTRVRRERVRRRGIVVAFGGAAVLVAAFVIAGGILRGGGQQGTLELSTVLKTETGQAEATVEVRKTGIGRVIELRSDSLPILPKGEYYELWFVGPGDSLARPNRISAGTFHPDEDGRSQVRFAAAVDPALYPRLVVTAEPGDGDPRPSSSEVLVSASS